MPTELTNATPKEKPAQLGARAGLLALAGMFYVPRKLIQIGTGRSVRVLLNRVNPRLYAVFSLSSKLLDSDLQFRSQI
jgi:hypothetical protein